MNQIYEIVKSGEYLELLEENKDFIMNFSETIIYIYLDLFINEADIPLIDGEKSLVEKSQAFE